MSTANVRITMLMAAMVLGSSLLAHSQTGEPAPAPASSQVAVTSDAKPDAKPDFKPWWRGISTDGFMSLSYTHNDNDPIPRINQFRVFDFNDDDPQLDVAQLVIQHAISEPKQFGFRFDLIAGSGVPEVTAAYGLFRDPRTGIAHHVDIPQLFVSYILPIRKGLRFDVGKFATHMGY